MSKNNKKTKPLFFGLLSLTVLAALFALSFDFLPPAKAIAIKPIDGGEEPGPTVTITVNPTSIKPGQSATLKWFSDADLVLSSNFGATSTSGTKTVSPDRTTSYIIRVKDSETGKIAGDQVSLEVADYQPMNIIDKTKMTFIWPGCNRSDYFCPAGTVACGLRSGYGSGDCTGGDVYQGVEMLCCGLTAEAVNKGVSLYGSTYSIDSGDSGGSMRCNGTDVLDGGEWAKHGQLDFGQCKPTSGLRLGTQWIVTIGYRGPNFLCPDGYVGYGGINYPGKNDAWGSMYCAKTLVNMYVPPSLTGTIQVNSVNSKTGAPVAASWYFRSGPADPCGGSLANCSGTSKTYSNVPTGVYSVGAPYLGQLSPSGYTLRGVTQTKEITASGNKESIFILLLKLITNVVRAVTPVGDCGTDTCNVPAGGTTTFTIKWDPLAQMSVSPALLNFTAPLGGSNPAGQNITVSNTGAAGSSLGWTAAADQSWIHLSKSSGSGILVGNPDSTTVTVDISGKPVGSYPGTVTFANESVTPIQRIDVPISLTITNNSPVVSSVTVTEPDYCVSGPSAYVNWTYSDPDGDPQSAFQVQVDSQGSSFNPPLTDSGKVSGSGTSYFVSGLPFNVTLKARVSVWDSNNNVSNWAYSGSWKTPTHAYPLIDFTWSPSTDIPAKQPVQFTDQTTFYDGGGTRIWSWLFGDSGSSGQQNPSHTYNLPGLYNVSLTSTDKDNFSCSRTKQINIAKPIPVWKEVSPK